MSVNYSAGLSPCESKGVCGLPELFDDPVKVEEKVKILFDWIKESKCVVIHCGAGISTSCGIPDFRGPKGVWTLEKLKAEEEKRKRKRKGKPKTDSSLKIKISKHDMGDTKIEFKIEKSTEQEADQGESSSDDKPVTQSITFEDSRPSYTHRALFKLLSSGHIHYIVSQNVDGLFLKTGIPRKYICELHGNFFLDECNVCESRFIRSTSSPTMGLKVSSNACPRPERPCRGFLRDTILDWDHGLPAGELKKAQKYSEKADLCICLGTSLQIVPAGNLPFICKKRKPNPGKVVIINLQSTRYNNQADLVIRAYVDSVMMLLCKYLNITVPDYDPTIDLTKQEKLPRIWK